MKLKTYNNISIYDIYNGAFSELAQDFYNESYELSVDDNYNLTAVAKKDVKFMPKIEITTIQDNGKYYYSPKLTFPVLNYENMNFYDDIAHWTNRWYDIGRLMTQLVDFVYDPDEWEDDIIY